MTVSTKTGRVIGRVALHQTFSGLVWSQDGKRLYAGGGFDDVIHGFDHAGGLLSNPVKLTFSEPIPGEGAAQRAAAPGRTGAGTRRRHALGRQCLQPHDRAVRHRGPEAEGRDLPRRTHLSLWADLGRAARPALREPLGQRRGRGRRYGAGPGRRPLENRGTSQRDAPGARGQDPLRGQRQPQHRLGLRHRDGQADRDHRHGDRPACPRRAARPAPWRSHPTSRCSSSPTPTPTTWPSSTSRSPARARRWASSRPAGIPPRSGSRATARRSTWPTARGRRRRPTATGRTRSPPGARTTRPASTSAASSGGHSRSSPMPTPPQMARLLADGLRLFAR